MDILEQLRTKNGTDAPDSQLLTQALGELNARINKNRERASTLEAELPAAVIRSIDAGATERRKLASVNSEHDGLVAAVVAVRAEITAALEREAAAAREQAWATATEAGDRLVTSAGKVAAAIDGLLPLFQQMIEDDTAFVDALPVRSHDFDPFHFRAAVAHAVGLRLYVALEGNLGAPLGVSKSPHEIHLLGADDLEGLARSQVTIGLSAQVKAEAVDAPVAESEVQHVEPD